MSLARWRDWASGWLPATALPDRPDLGARYPWRQVVLHDTRRAEAAAHRVLKRAACLGLDWRVGLSGGKDSTAMALLCREHGFHARGMSVKDDLDYPGERDYLAALCTHAALELDIIGPPISLVAWLRDSSACLVEDLHSRTADLSRRWFYDVLDGYQQEQGYDGVLLGLRGQESPGRQANATYRGSIYRRKDGLTVAQPLASWSALDVHAYLWRRQVPVLPVYLCIDPGAEPFALRKSWWVCGGGPARYGHYAWLRRWWPDLWRVAATIDPEVAAIS